MINSILISILLQSGEIPRFEGPTFRQNVRELATEMERRGMQRVIVVPTALTRNVSRPKIAGRPRARGDFNIGDALGIVNLLGGGVGGFPGGGFPGGGFPGGGFPGGGFPGGGLGNFTGNIPGG